MLPFIWVAFGLEARNNTGKLWLTSRWWWSGGVRSCSKATNKPSQKGKEDFYCGPWYEVLWSLFTQLPPSPPSLFWVLLDVKF